MATLDGNTNYAVNFSSLTSPAVVAIIFLVVGLILEDSLKRLRRYPVEDALRRKGTILRDRGSEGWAMGYLFRSRTYNTHSPTKDYSPYPLSWIVDAVRSKERDFLPLGGDCSAYIRLLRGWFYWTLLMTLTVFPLLLAIHLTFAPPSVLTSSIDRASIASLVQSTVGLELLWVHVVCIWLATFSYFATMYWVGTGVVENRRKELRSFIKEETDSLGSGGNETSPNHDATIRRDGVRLEDVGWRFRTVMMRNLPPSLRSEAAIREYFEHHLQCSPSLSQSPFQSSSTPSTPKADSNHVDPHTHSIVNIIIVRKQDELNIKYRQRQDSLALLEAAHVSLALNVMEFVEKKVKSETQPPRRGLFRWTRAKEEVSDAEEMIGDNLLVDTLRGFVAGTEPPVDAYGRPISIWTVLHSLPRHLLDAYQPLLRLKHFRGQQIPAIDYHLTKLNLFTSLVEDDRSHSEENFSPTPAAFVTFSDAKTARRARKEIESSAFKTSKRKEGGLLNVRIDTAPAVSDLVWSRLVKVSIAGDVLRGVLFQALIWIATLFYLLPVSAALSLISVDSISRFFPGFADYLSNNRVLSSILTNLVPTAIIALLGMLTPTLIGILTRNGEVFFTTSSLHNAIQSRYWKWLVINIVVVFCIGLSAFSAFLDIFRNGPGSVLEIIAISFPKGATFFVSWSLLIIGVQHGIAIALLGIPYINHASIRKMLSPRQRAGEDGAWPRAFLAYYFLPNHLLVNGVTAIFALLNPLVIPFNFAFFLFALVTFKNQFAHIYYRRWFELNGRVTYRRAFRYSLDSFIFAQIVALAFLFVVRKPKLGGAVIPLVPVTAFVKLIGTRWFDALMDQLDELEIDLVCNEEAYDIAVQTTATEKRFGSLSRFATVTLPALTLRPKSRLPDTGTTSILGPQYRPRANSSAKRLNTISQFATAEQEKPNSQLISIHPPVLRNDRPVFHLKYDNPALVNFLETSLWLPDDPLLPVDIGRTIDFQAVLVSSVGGRGIIGGFDFDAETDGLQTEHKVEEKEVVPAMSPLRSTLSNLSLRLERAGSRRRTSGSERIQVAPDIAAKSELEEGGVFSRVAMPRRGTGASLTPRASPLPLHVEEGIVTHSPEPLNVLSQSPESFPFPPPPMSADRRSASEPFDRPQYSDPLRRRMENYTTVPPLVPRHSTQSTLNRLSMARTSQFSGASDAATISQSSALREELLIDARNAMKEYHIKREKREAKERIDEEDGSWFNRFVTRASEAEVDR